MHGAPGPSGCTTLRVLLGIDYLSLLLQEAKIAFSPAVDNPSPADHVVRSGGGGQEIPVTDEITIPPCCPTAADFSGLRSAFFPLNLNSHGAVCVTCLVFQLGMRQPALLRCTRALSYASHSVCCLPVLDGRCWSASGLWLL